MESSGGAWREDGNWRSRYSQLYSSRNVIVQPSYESSSRRISLLSSDLTPNCSRSRDSHGLPNILSPSSNGGSVNDGSTSMSGIICNQETQLLDMLRKQVKKEEAELVKPIIIPKDDEIEDDEDDLFDNECYHGLNMRHNPEGSVSRSRISKISTKRDIDIPSLMAFSNSIAKSIIKPQPVEIPAFREESSTNSQELPRWSIRRSVCPVCSQKWRDNSSIKIIKYSGLKRNTSLELQSVIAPARLRTSLAISYVPRPAPIAVDQDAGMVYGGWRSSNRSKNSWKLSRARRFRAPKPKLPSPEAIAPPDISAPLARKDLDLRVSQFLKS